MATGELLAEAVVRHLDTLTGIEGVCGQLFGVIERVDEGEVVLGHQVTLMDATEPTAGPGAAQARWVPVADVIDYHLAPGLAEFLHDHRVIETIT